MSILGHEVDSRSLGTNMPFWPSLRCLVACLFEIWKIHSRFAYGAQAAQGLAPLSLLCQPSLLLVHLRCGHSAQCCTAPEHALHLRCNAVPVATCGAGGFRAAAHGQLAAATYLAGVVSEIDWR